MSKLYKTYYDLAKLVIWSDEPINPDVTTKARLVFSFRDGNPRITVYTGLQGPSGVISFPSDYPTMTYALNKLKDIANGPNDNKVIIESLTSVYIDNKITSDKRLVSTLHVGKSKDGILYISVVSDDKPKIVFPIKTSPYHVFKDKDGNIIPESELSKDLTLGICDLVLELLSNAIQQYTNEEYTVGDRKPTPIRQNGTYQKQQPAPLNDEISSDIDALDL